MTTSLASCRSACVLAVLFAAAACQNAPSAPSLSPTAPSLSPSAHSLSPAATSWLARESSAGAVRSSSSVDVGACLSAPDPSCFTAARSEATAVAAEPVTGPPISLAGSVNGTTVTLVWGPPSFQDAPVLSYIIDVGSRAGFTTPDLLSLDTFSASTTLQAQGVAAGTYYVRIRARNALGISLPSNEIQVVVGIINFPGPNCPGAPRSLTGAGSFGTVTLSWQPPLTGTVQSYIIEAGTAPGAANIGSLNNGPAIGFVRAGVPAGVYYVRIRAVGAGCAPGPPSNELAVTVSNPLNPPGGGGGGGPTSVTLTLVYNCGSSCSGDPDNYELSVDCVNGRCRTTRTSNPRSSGTITTSVSGAGVHNVEVIARFASWTLTMRGGMTPNSWRIIYPTGGTGLSVGSCQITSTSPEMYTEFMVGGGSC